MSRATKTAPKIAAPTRTYSWRTDAAHGHVEASSIEDVCEHLRWSAEWSVIGGSGEASDIADGAWLRIMDADGVTIYTRGTPA